MTRKEQAPTTADFRLREECEIHKSLNNLLHAKKFQPEAFAQNTLLTALLATKKDKTRNLLLDEALESGCQMDILVTWSILFSNAELLKTLNNHTLINWETAKPNFSILVKEDFTKNSNRYLETEHYNIQSNVYSMLTKHPTLGHLLINQGDMDLIETVLDSSFSNNWNKELRLNCESKSNSINNLSLMKSSSSGQNLVGAVALSLGQSKIAAHLFSINGWPTSQEDLQSILDGAVEGMTQKNLSSSWIEKALDKGAIWPMKMDFNGESMSLIPGNLGGFDWVVGSVLEKIAGRKGGESNESIKNAHLKKWVKQWLDETPEPAQFAKNLWHWEVDGSFQGVWSDCLEVICKNLPTPKSPKDFLQEALYQDLGDDISSGDFDLTFSRVRAAFKTWPKIFPSLTSDVLFELLSNTREDVEKLTKYNPHVWNDIGALSSLMEKTDGESWKTFVTDIKARDLKKKETRSAADHESYELAWQTPPCPPKQKLRM